MKHKLKKYLSEIFDIKQENITDEYALGSSGWDSLKHMELVFFIQNKYGIEPTEDNVIKMMTFQGILDIIQNCNIKYNNNNNNNITESDFVEALKYIGLCNGDDVFVQSSIGTFGRIENSLEIIKNAFLSVIGKDGTLAVPTFTTNSIKKESFNVDQSVSESGIFSEYIRTMPNALRSVHPFHSIAAIGSKSKIFANVKSKTSFSRDSVFGKMYDLDFKLCFLGTTLKHCTFFHYVEEQCNVPYRFFVKISSSVTNKGKTIPFLHDYFARYSEPLIIADFHKPGEKIFKEAGGKKKFIGSGPIYLVSARALVDTTLLHLSNEQTYLIADKDKWKVQEILNGNFKK